MSNGYSIPTIPDILSTYGIPQIVKRVKETVKERKWHASPQPSDLPNPSRKRKRPNSAADFSTAASDPSLITTS
jgi:hypothetical protein